MKPTLFVAGLGRCGTSLVLQMLDAAGMKCAGKYPDFEPVEMKSFSKPVDTSWLKSNAGSAIKWLDPHKVRVATSEIDASVIWMHRDHHQQAKSQAKFMEALLGVHLARSDISKLKNQLRTETKLALRATRPLPLHVICFERLLSEPAETAANIVQFLHGTGHQFSHDPVSLMADQVIPRKPKCMPDLSIEAFLVEQSRC